MNYIGSKYKLLHFVKDTICRVAGSDLSQKIFCDLFAGTGIVGRTFKSLCKTIIANDCEYYSYVLNKNYIGNCFDIPDKQQYIDELNELSLIDHGFIYQHYCLGGGNHETERQGSKHGRQYFSDFNGKKIDAIRQGIEMWRTTGRIGDNLYYFLLASLLESADKLANTASVYGAYLKHLKKSAQKELILEPADFTVHHHSGNAHTHAVFNEDSNTLINTIEGDILYLDPPYNARQYGANYHLLNTIAKYDHFVPHGKTGLRHYQKSAWCRRGKVEKEFDNLLNNATTQRSDGTGARFKYIFLSYNNEGLMSLETIKKIMAQYGHYDLASTNYQRFKADREGNRIHKADTTEEFIHIVEVR
jgi:adenine-specific DNA-methyltransferase